MLLLGMTGALGAISIAIAVWAIFRDRRRERDRSLALNVIRRRAHATITAETILVLAIGSDGLITWIGESRFAASSRQRVGLPYYPLVAEDPEVIRAIRDAFYGTSPELFTTWNNQPVRISIRPITAEQGAIDEVIVSIVEVGHGADGNTSINQPERTDREFLKAMDDFLRVHTRNDPDVAEHFNVSDATLEDQNSMGTQNQLAERTLEFIEIVRKQTNGNGNSAAIEAEAHSLRKLVVDAGGATPGKLRARNASSQKSQAQAWEILDRRQANLSSVASTLYEDGTNFVTWSLFLDRLAHALLRATRSDTALAVGIVEVAAPPASGAAIEVIGERIVESLRTVDTVSHHTPFHFAILLEDVSSPSTVRIAISRTLEAIRRPVVVDHQEIALVTNIGLVLSLPPHADTPTAIRKATAALGRVRTIESLDFAIFDPLIDSRELEEIGNEQAKGIATAS